MPRPSSLAPLSVAAVLLATAGASVAAPAGAVESVVPTDPVNGQRTPIVLDGPGSGVLAFTGAVRNARPAVYADRAAAERAGLTAFDVEPAHNGFFRLRVARTTVCLDLLRGAPLTARPTENGCETASGLWNVADGIVASASGVVLTDVLHDPTGVPAVTAVPDRSLAADSGISIDRTEPVGPAAASFSTPSHGSQVVADGSAREGDRVVLADVAGNDLGSGIAEPDGRWRIAVDRRDSRGGPLEVLVSVVRGDDVVARSWHTVEYGAPVTVDRQSVPTGSVVVTGRGEPGARVSAASGADGVTTVAPDGTWRMDVSVRGAVNTAIEIGQNGAGSALSLVRLPVTALDETVPAAEPVFTADTAESAYVEGDTDPGREVEVSDESGTVVGTGTADRYGHYEIEIPAPDRAGDVSFDVEEIVDGTPVASGSVVVDYGAPVEITSPRPGEAVSDGTTVEGTGEPGSEVALSLDGDPLHAIVDEDGRWSFQLGTATDRPFALTTPSTLDFTARDKPSITGTGTPGATVRFQPRGADDTADATDTSVRSDGTWRIDGRDLRLDPRTGHDAVVIHAPGTSSERTEALRLDSDLREIEVTSPSAGATVRTADGDVTFTGTATPGDHITLVANGLTMPRAVTVDADGTWQMTQRFAAGAFSLRFVSETSGVIANHPITVEPDGVGALVVGAPAAGDRVTADNGVLFGGTATPGARVDLRFDRPTGIAASAVADAQGNWAVRATRIPFGDVTVYASVADGAPVRLPITVD